MIISEILNRIQEALGAKSISAATKELGFRGTEYSTWKGRDIVPYKACVLCNEKTGVTIEWLLTGKGQKFSSIGGISSKSVKQAFDKALHTGAQLGFISFNEKTTPENLDALADFLIRELEEQGASLGEAGQQKDASA